MALKSLSQTERLDLAFFERRYLVDLELPSKTLRFSDRNYKYKYRGSFTMQDYTEYTEVDIPADRVSVLGLQCDMLNLDDDETVYVYKDFGAGYFAGDFEHRLRFRCTGYTGAALCVIWALSNDLGDMRALTVANKDMLYVLYRADNHTLYLTECVAGNLQTSAITNLSDSTYYFLTIRRVLGTDSPGDLYLYVYSDGARTQEVGHVKLALTEQQQFGYLYVMSSYNIGSGGKAWSGDVGWESIASYVTQNYENYVYDLSRLPVDLARARAGRNQRITLRFRNEQILDVDRLIELSSTYRFCFSTVKIYELRLIAPGETFESDVKQLVFRGVCGQPHGITRREFQIDAHNVLLAKRDRLPLQVVDTAVDANADPDDVGKVRNTVYGAVADVPCRCVKAGAKDTLRDDLNSSATSFYVSGDTKIAFPSTGTLQIDDEQITYTGFSSNQFTGCTRGANGTTAVAHNKGAAVFQVLSEYIYEIAKHPVKAITAVYVDGVKQTAGFTAYTGQSGDELAGYEGRAVVKFTVKPVVKKQINVTVLAAEFSMDTGAHAHGVTEEIVVWNFDTGATASGSPYAPECAADGDLNTAATLYDNSPLDSITVSKAYYQQYQGNPTHIRACAKAGVIDGSGAFSFSFAGVSVSMNAGESNTVKKGSWTALGASYDTWAELNAATGTVACTAAPASQCKVAEVWVEIKYTPSIANNAATGVVLTGSSVPVGNSSADTVIGALVHCDIEGYRDDGAGSYTGTPNALIERPDHVFRHILVALLGESASDIGSSFATSGTSYGSTYKLAFILHEVAHQADRLLQELAFQCRSKTLEWKGKFELIYLGIAPAATKTFTDDDLLEEPVFGYTAEIDIRNRIYAKHSRDYRKSGAEAYDGVASASDATSITNNGERVGEIELSACRDATMAADWVAWRLTQVKQEWRTLEIVTAWIGKALDAGETFSLTWDFFTGVTWDLVDADIDPMHERIKLLGHEWPS